VCSRAFMKLISEHQAGEACSKRARGLLRKGGSSTVSSHYLSQQGAGKDCSKPERGGGGAQHSVQPLLKSTAGW
jgi:hypothetical protein